MSEGLNSQEPAQYFPWLNGRYEVKANFHSLARSFGNAQDQRVFQIDRLYGDYLAKKRQNIREHRDNHAGQQGYESALQGTINQFICTQLCHEYPHEFHLSRHTNNWYLYNRLTRETLLFDCHWQCRDQSSFAQINALVALGDQIQEDLAVVLVTAHADQLVAVNVCFPNYWAPQEKLGQNFTRIHAPIPHSEQLRQAHRALLKNVLNHSPLVRFTWGVSPSAELNQHSWRQIPAGPDRFSNRGFSIFYVRVERQILWAFPAQGLILFLIRTYLYEVTTLPKNTIPALIGAIESMSTAAATYKGIQNCRNRILEILQSQLQ